jgi:hypothetical protein
MAKQPEYPKHIAAVRLNAALRVRPYTETQGFRYYLAGVHIEPSPDGGVICAATDGHRLGVRRDPEGLCFTPAIVKLSPLLKSSKKPKWLIVTLTGETMGYVSVVPVQQDDTPEAAIERVEQAELRIGDAIISGEFPNWRRVIPTSTGVTRSFNAKYFASFGEHISISGSDGSSPHLVRDAADPEFFGVLMPMRADEPKVPSWAATVKVAEAA